MLIPDMPNMPPQNVPVMIAQANQAQPNDVTAIRTMGACQIIPNAANAPPSLENTISPKDVAQGYFYFYENQKTVSGTSTITILQQPKHGTLRLVTEADRGTVFHSSAGSVDPATGLYVYLPEQGYFGDDSATVLVDIDGVKVKVVYFFQTIDVASVGEGLEEALCEKGTHWKISSTIDANGNSTITSVEYQSSVIDASASITDTAALTSILGSNILGSLVGDTAGVTLTFADLPGGAVGQTTGNTITLDDNAAGNNWFIDTTPNLNEEYLPTSNPNEWVAKEGSEAAGKMDMLSVLLHEYGHALGIEHSADGHDYMGTTLTPGVRRLPSAGELALMQQLIGQAKATLTPTLSQWERGQNGTPDNTPLPLPIPLGGSMGLAFLGRLRGSRFGGVSIEADLSTLVTQYDVSANAVFTNLDTAAGWNTQGSVDIASGVATLNEVSNSQTRLSQVFLVGERGRYLSFTLSGTALDDLTGALPLPNPLPQAGEGATVAASGSGFGPSDAFEVALLDANAGLSLLGSDGMSRSDAFLNLQADGTERSATGVTRIVNGDGSRTYRVDLTGIAA